MVKVKVPRGRGSEVELARRVLTAESDRQTNGRVVRERVVQIRSGQARSSQRQRSHEWVVDVWRTLARLLGRKGKGAELAKHDETAMAITIQNETET